MPPRRHATHTEAGYSLIEILVTVLLVSVLLGFAVGGWRGWALAEAHKGTAHGIQSMLRNAQVRAVTEGVAMCVRFDPASDTYALYRYVDDGDPSDDGTPDDCTERVKGPVATGDPRVHLTLPRFIAPDGSIYPAATFRPSGSAWPGSIKVTRDGAGRAYTLNVEGLTGRVHVS